MSVFFTRRGGSPVLCVDVRRISTFSAICLAGVLGACNTLTIPDAPAPEPVPPMVIRNEIVPITKPELQPTPGLTDLERLRHAIALLEVGRSSQAKVELQAYLGVAPDSTVAQRLLFQIEAPSTFCFQMRISLFS